MKDSFPENIDHRWTLFLDRDGVINQRIIDGYVTDYSEFIFCEGVLSSLAFFTTFFNRIIIITNQQGIGKGLMTEDDLSIIHACMLEDIEDAGGKIDSIYHCPQLHNTPANYRKPSPAMATMAACDFPDIDLSLSLMAGDSKSDIEFGINAGMKTAFIGNKPSFNADITVADLPALVSFIKNHCL